MLACPQKIAPSPSCQSCQSSPILRASRFIARILLAGPSTPRDASGPFLLFLSFSSSSFSSVFTRAAHFRLFHSFVVLSHFSPNTHCAAAADRASVGRKRRGIAAPISRRSLSLPLSHFPPSSLINFLSHAALPYFCGLGSCCGRADRSFSHFAALPFLFPRLSIFFLGLFIFFSSFVILSSRHLNSFSFLPATVPVSWPRFVFRRVFRICRIRFIFASSIIVPVRLISLGIATLQH